jgi:hypothetical protein
MPTTRTLLRSALVIAVFSAGTTAYAQDESTIINGRIFVDLSNISLKNGGIDQPASGTGLDVKRFYFGATHNFDKTWSVNFTSDFNYVGNDGETQLYVKKAFVQAKVYDALSARLGSADLPWIPWDEDIYGYRYVELTIIDRLKFGTSADWGLNANGKTKGGALSYSISAVNGGGYKNPTRTSTMDAEGRLAWSPIPTVTIAAGFYNGKLGKDVSGSTTPAINTAERFDALVTYIKSGFRIGLEYFSADNWYNVTTAATDKADGYAFWVSYDFTPRYGIFARTDSANLSTTLNPNLEDTYYNLGFAIHARKNVDFSIVYKNDKVDGGTWSSSNGVIGSATGGKYEEIGIFALVQF